MPGDSRRTSRQGGVWLVNHYADAPDRPSGTRHYDLARQMLRRGHPVTVFASGFSHVTQREERLGNGQLYRSQWFDGVRFVWLRTIPYRGNTWRRQANMLSFLVVFLIVQTRFSAPEAVVGSTVHPFAALGAWLVARARGGRFLFEIRDLWPQTLVDLGAMRQGSVGERLLRALEALLVRRATTVIALLPGVRDYLRDQGLPADHVVYLPNGVDLAIFDELAQADDEGAPAAVGSGLATIRELRSQGRLVVGYVGSFGRVNDVGVIIEAAALAEVRAPGRVAVVLIGDGPERSDLERRAADVASVAICPAVAKRFVPRVLVELDAAVVHATATPVYRYGMSFNKLFEYMAAGRPVIFACASAYDPVAAEGAGLTVAPDDPEALAAALLGLVDIGPVARSRMGASGRRHVEREHSIERLGRTFERIVSGDGDLAPLEPADSIGT
jgi:glycosyltransferase involved in cell wall biosynthesis